MSQPPYGPPGQNPPYPQGPQGPHGQQGPPPGQYGGPPMGPPPGQYGGPPPQAPYGGPPQGPPQYAASYQQPPPGPGFGWGPSFGPGGPGGPGGPNLGWQQPRKKSKGPLIAILSIVAVAVVGGALIGLIRQGDDTTTTTPVNPTRYTPQPTTSPTEEPTGSPTEEPTQEPTTEEPTSTETSSPPNQSSDSTVVAKNKLYQVGQMATVNCREPRVRPTNAQNAAAYWAELKPCLDKSWAPLVTKAGYQYKSPGMTYWSGSSVSNPCGAGIVNVPFYCPANHMMYMKVDVFVKAYTQYPGDPIGQAYARMWYSRSIAHEYGHSVQFMTGVLRAANNLRYEQPDSDGRLRMTRRIELQANCFAGVFLAANKRSYPINGNLLYVWNKYVVTAGDKPEVSTHGSVASQGRFMGKAFNTANPATCNTFAASPANVS
ncbi:neutral zinc metallopeptidase [Kribbella sp. HUAS MG21]|uniref:Neutral zinc metallopeptidase n=1 Tax=Kribbella sp. HUAS MG21 TaxID=3160966 RepID=A0AAU7TGR1_9ACTN